jgi:hypothetical protein
VVEQQGEQQEDDGDLPRTTKCRGQRENLGLGEVWDAKNGSENVLEQYPRHPVMWRDFYDCWIDGWMVPGGDETTKRGENRQHLENLHWISSWTRWKQLRLHA